MSEPRPAGNVSELLAMVDAEWQRLLQAVDRVGEDRLEEPLLHGGSGRLTPREARCRALETHAAMREVLADIPDDRLSALHTVDDDGFSPAADGRPRAWLIAVETHWHYSDHAAALSALFASP